MYTIYLYQERDMVFHHYQSYILPQVGDVYSSVDIPDGQARIVTKRMLNPTNLSSSITIFVDYQFPNLVPQKETTEAETNY